MNAFLPGNLPHYLGAMRGLYGNPGQPQGGAMMPGGLPMGDGGTGHAGFGQAFQPRDPLATAGGLPPQQMPQWQTGGPMAPQQTGQPMHTGGPGQMMGSSFGAMLPIMEPEPQRAPNPFARMAFRR